MSTSSTPNLNKLLSNLIFESHATYREDTLLHRRINQETILPLIDKRQNTLNYLIEKVGFSFEGRVIQMLRIGTGPRKVLLWTQMHGDEATATMACFDILNFLDGENDDLDDVRKKILTETTLYFIPMLNPDGAERFQRRNAQNIDLNRDALALQAPESNILKSIQQSLQPEFGFNLHDKNPRYSVGSTNKLATMSFLATAYDQDKNVNDVRRKSMQLIVGMNRTLQNFIPNQIGRWNEDFEPRAFGDNIQKWGTTLILIESGGYAGDPEKQYIRKLNYVAILSGLHSIATNSYQNEDIKEYYALQENDRYIYDLLIKKASISQASSSFQIDLGINRNEINVLHNRSFYYKSVIEELGDLSIFHGTQELDADGYQLTPGKTYTIVFNSVDECSLQQAWTLLKQGFTSIICKGGDRNIPQTDFPLQIVEEETTTGPIPDLDQDAYFILSKNGVNKYAVVNGFVFDLETSCRI